MSTAAHWRRGDQKGRRLGTQIWIYPAGGSSLLGSAAGGHPHEEVRGGELGQEMCACCGACGMVGEPELHEHTACRNQARHEAAARHCRSGAAVVRRTLPHPPLYWSDVMISPEAPPNLDGREGF